MKNLEWLEASSLSGGVAEGQRKIVLEKITYCKLRAWALIYASILYLSANNIFTYFLVCLWLQEDHHGHELH